MGLDNLPEHIKTQQQAVDYFATLAGVTDHELIEHERIQISGWMRWTRTLWTINKGTIICHLLYESKDLEGPGYEHGEDPYSWYYQAYTEHAGPCMLNVPIRMLEATTCPPQKWAREWRESVLEYAGVPRSDWKKYF